MRSAGGRGWVLAAVAIIGLSLNMRAVISGLAPIADQISRDLPLSTTILGLLGSLPPITFAVAGVVVPFMVRLWGSDRVAVIALVAIAVGNIGRGFAASVGVLAVTTVIGLVGIGIGNVLVPVLIKKHLPDKIVAATALSVSAMAFGTAIPAAAVYPLGEAFGWRFALGIWGALAVLAIIPWAGLLRRSRAAGTVMPRRVRSLSAFQLVRSPSAWVLVFTFAVAQVNIYAMFGWLPVILRDVAGVSPAEAGVLVGLFAVMGMFVGLLLGAFAPRISQPAVLIHVMLIMLLVGYGGLILAPTPAIWLWVALTGVGPASMQVCLMLVGLRTRSHDAALALSSFMQSVGYALGTAGPVLLGTFYDTFGTWETPLIALIVLVLITLVVALPLLKPRFVEDDLGLP